MDVLSIISKDLLYEEINAGYNGQVSTHCDMTLAMKEAYLRIREQEIIQKEQILKSIEEKETELNIREQTLIQKEQEFELHKKIREIACENIFNIDNYLLEVNNLLKSVRKETIELRNCITFENLRSCLKELSNIERIIFNIPILKETEILSKITEIFSFFGVKMIKPCNGEIYDSKFHEREDIMIQNGNIIIECVTHGWVLENYVIVRAIVKTNKK